MIVIPFRVSIPRDRQDPLLAKKLKVELPGIFNWAVEGLRDLRRAGVFQIPTVCQDAWRDLRSESNPAGEFISGRYEAGGAEDRVLSEDIYAAYKDWCLSQEFKPLDATSFGKEVRRVSGDITRNRDLKRFSTLPSRPACGWESCWDFVGQISI